MPFTFDSSNNIILMKYTYFMFYLLYHFIYRDIIAHIFETLFCDWQLSNIPFS